MASRRKGCLFKHAHRAAHKLERVFDPAVIQQLKANAPHDISFDGPTLASSALNAGLVDEIHMIICPVHNSNKPKACHNKAVSLLADRPFCFVPLLHLTETAKTDN